MYYYMENPVKTECENAKASFSTELACKIQYIFFFPLHFSTFILGKNEVLGLLYMFSFKKMNLE